MGWGEGISDLFSEGKSLKKWTWPKRQITVNVCKFSPDDSGGVCGPFLLGSSSSFASDLSSRCFSLDSGHSSSFFSLYNIISETSAYLTMQLKLSTRRWITQIEHFQFKHTKRNRHNVMTLSGEIPIYTPQSTLLSKQQWVSENFRSTSSKRENQTAFYPESWQIDAPGSSLSLVWIRSSKKIREIWWEIWMCHCWCNDSRHRLACYILTLETGVKKKFAYQWKLPTQECHNARKKREHDTKSNANLFVFVADFFFVPPIVKRLKSCALHHAFVHVSTDDGLRKKTWRQANKSNCAEYPHPATKFALAPELISDTTRYGLHCPADQFVCHHRTWMIEKAKWRGMVLENCTFNCPTTCSNTLTKVFSSTSRWLSSDSSLITWSRDKSSSDTATENVTVANNCVRNIMTEKVKQTICSATTNAWEVSPPP